MRYQLVTPLASRDGSTDKDEKLVNAYAEVDKETQETSVFKRAGIDQGDAVISGNDIYGQGLFNYDGYLFAMCGDVLGYWVYVGGGTMYGGGGGTYFNESLTQDFNPSQTYDINETVIYEGQKLYSYSNNNDAPPNNEYGQYMWGATASQTQYVYATLAGGYWSGSPAAACNSYLWELSKSSPSTETAYVSASYPGSCTWMQGPNNEYGPFNSGITRA